MPDAPTFIVADDHPLFRNALRQTLEPHFPGARMLEAGTLDEVAAAIEATTEPDLVLFDLSMPGARGFSGLMYLRAQYPAVPVCVVSASEDHGTIRRSLGARRRRLRAEILAAGADPPGDRGDPRRRDLDAARPRSRARLERGRRARRAGFAASLRSSSRVLMMMGEGLLNKQIAYELSVSEATVKAHVSAVLQKLGVENRTKAVLAAGRFELGQWMAHPAE